MEDDMTRQQMDSLVDGHYRAEETADIEAIVAGFTRDAEHDVAGRPGGPLHGGEQIAGYYRELLSALRIDRFEPVRRWYGADHVADESILHAVAEGEVLGRPGGGRSVRVRLLHVFDFADGLIARESAWLDVAGLQQQLA
jgi:steroid delta-isomerase-like uncharacterized protein